MKNREWNDQVKQVLDGDRELESLSPELQREAEAARRLLLEAIDRRAVTLSGAVELPKQRDKAERLAHKVKGVSSVVNKIEVKARVPGK